MFKIEVMFFTGMESIIMVKNLDTEANSLAVWLSAHI